MDPPADGENQAENLGCNFVTAILPTKETHVQKARNTSNLQQSD